jgi:Ca2+-binding EF-hand superfamily protein
MSDSEPRFSATPAELRREFKRVDRDVDGSISYAEFKELLTGLDAQMSEEEMQLGFHEVDTDRDGKIDLQEFSDWWVTD